MDSKKPDRATLFVLFSTLAFAKSGIAIRQPFSSLQLNSGSSFSSFSSLIGLSHDNDVPDTRHLSREAAGIRVVGGTEADPHQFPFQISLQVRNYFGGYDHHCGGVIYDETHILTSAHCVRGIHQNNLKIAAGEHEIFNDAGPEQYRDVASYVFHPAFDPVTLENDIAIITLDYPLDLNDFVKPLALPSNVGQYSQTAQTCGWGKTGYSDEQQLKLLYVDLDVFTKDQCLEAWAGKIMNGMLCAGDRNGNDPKGSCNGDSGSGLFCRDENGNDYLCGLVSWGANDCLAPLPTVFTDIASYLDWLRALLPTPEHVAVHSHQ